MLSAEEIQEIVFIRREELGCFADLSPIETELVAQARLTAGFRSTMKDLDFAERINLHIEANAVQWPETPQ